MQENNYYWNKEELLKLLQLLLEKRRSKKKVSVPLSMKRIETENRMLWLSNFIRYSQILGISPKELQKRFATEFLRNSADVNRYLESVAGELNHVKALLKLLKFIRIQASLTQMDVAWSMGYEGSNSQISLRENGIGNPYFIFFTNFLLACGFSKEEITDSLRRIIR